MDTGSICGGTVWTSTDMAMGGNIYIGENGLGKTTILNCLYYVLEK